ncbi:MAG: hypothetical protein ACOC36_03120, partial [Fibrobacterota bacterium]
NSFVFERLRGTYPSVNDTALIGIALPDTLVELEKVETSGKMFTMVEFTNFENEVRSAELSDSAAPVVVRAVYHPAVAYDEETVLLDTLEVTFSERIAPPGNQTPLRFIQNGVEYEVALSTESVNNRSVNFLINEIRGVDRMTSGDSVWINPGEFVRDSVPNWQQNEYNSRVPLVIKSTPVTWKVVTGPNPFTRNKQVKIRIVPLGMTRIAFSPEVSIVIYDNLGNVVVPRTEFSMVDGVPQFEWNGTNRKGRYVGTGVYLGMIVVEEEETVTRKKVKLAVRRP